MQFTKATKKQAKLRLAEFGPSGSGKTFTALRIATGLGGRIAVIDTERGSASKYADRFSFDVLELQDRTIDGYCAAIAAASQSGFNVLIIDSLSHGWKELLQEVDRLANAKFRGNTWSAWSEGTPKQQRLIDTLLSAPLHIIATMRSKTEWAQEQTSNGRVKPVKVGLAPEQGKGIEYEFDMLLELSTEHIAIVTKDRTGKFQDQSIEKPGEDFGKALAAWLEQGDPGQPSPVNAQDELREHFDRPTAAGAPANAPAADKPADPLADDEKFVAILQDAFNDGGWHPDEINACIAHVCKSKKITRIVRLNLEQRHGMLKAVVDGKWDNAEWRKHKPVSVGPADEGGF